jgi:transcriptional regulator with XRE-family HTH domain
MGARLRSARQARHWTLAEAAARFGFPPSTLGEYEQGRSDIPIAVLQRAPEVYGQAGDPQVILFGRQPVRHACEFLDFTLMVAEDNSLRRVVLALAQDDTRRREAERILTDATRVKKLREPPGPE